MNGLVAVDGDGAQVEDGGGAHEDVEGEPHVAEDFSEDPLADREEHDVERHDADRHQNVGHCQAHDEEVLHAVERLVCEHADDDQNVADDRDQDAHAAPHHEHKQLEQHRRLRDVTLLTRR